MKSLLAAAIDRTVKQRLPGSYAAYAIARRVVAAFENRDVDMARNGEHWLQARIAERGPVTAMDIGANGGEWVAALLDVAKDCRVICYEPVPTTFETLTRNVADPRAELVNKAMSSEPGEITINSVVDNPYLSTIYDIDALRAGYEVVKFTIEASTGDAEIAAHGLAHVDIVKVDAEGHDLAVIQGFAGAIEAGTVDVFQFEYNHFTLLARTALRDFFALLEERYLLCRLLPHGLEAFGYDASIDTFAQSNWVAVRKAILDETTILNWAITPAAGLPRLTLVQALKDEPDLARRLGLG